MKKTSLAKSLGSQKALAEFEKYFKAHLKQLFDISFLKPKSLNETSLKKSCLYTLSTPSSYFRSLLAIETTKYLNQDPKKIFPWAMAIEIFHSGSLIHDDLPSMDNGKMRRGQKCNHLVFGEDVSLLAGSCLFVESFSLLKQPVFKNKVAQILDLFISKTGFRGLMSGQALDLKLKNPTRAEVLTMAHLKTGSLIEAAVEGPLLLWVKNQKTKKALLNFAKYLGMAYQIADDLQDKDSLLKLEESKKLLKNLTQKSLESLKGLKEEAVALKSLSLLNEKRAEKFNK